MLHKLILALTFLFSVTVAPAQNETPPPALDAPDHWEIHGPDGATGLEMRPVLMGDGQGIQTYYIFVTGTLNGQPYSSYAIAYVINGNRQEIPVYNGDSGLWTEWHWNEDHYDKVGGSPSRRSYHPVY